MEPTASSCRSCCHVGITHGESKFEVVMPMRRDLADYDIRVAEIIETISAVENRSQLEIIRDLFRSSSDVVRLRARPGGSSTGMVSIDEGVVLYEQARDLIMAAACSTEQKKAVFPSRKPNKAINYVKETKFGQTEHGSYVLTIVSPVSPTSEVLQSPNDLFSDGTFGRRVIITLASAVSKVRAAALSAAVTGKINVFDETVQHGVSANLCDAIVGIS